MQHYFSGSGALPELTSATVEDADTDVLDLVFGQAVNITTAGWSIFTDGPTPITVSSVLSGDGTTTPKLQLSRDVYSDETLYAVYSGVDDTEFVSGPTALGIVYQLITNNSALVAGSPIEVFDPANVLWYRASVTTVTGTDVDTAPNQGSASKTLTSIAGRKPTLSTDANGKKWIVFAGAQSMRVLWTGWSSVASDYLVFAVMKPGCAVPAAAAQRMTGGEAGNRVLIDVPQSANMPNKYHGSIAGDFGPVPNSVDLLEYDFEDPSKRMKIWGRDNSAVPGAYTKMTLDSGFYFHVGDNNGAGSSAFTGELAELVVIKATATAAEKAELRQYFNGLYPNSLYPRFNWGNNGKTGILKYDETVVETGAGGLTYLGFPKWAIDSNNRLHQAQSEAPNHNNNDDQRIIYKYSDDGGYTFSSKVVVQSEDPPEITGDDRQLYTMGGIGTTASGRIFIRFHKAPVIAGIPTPAQAQPWMTHSDDNGATWAAPYLVTNDYAAPGQCSGPANPLEYGGALHVFMYGRTTGSGFRDVVQYKSTDYLTSETPTFSLVSIIHLATAFDPEEPEVVQINGPFWVCLIRSDSNKAYHAFTWDAGVTWSQEGLTNERPIMYQSVGFNGSGVSPNESILSFGRESVTTRTRVHFSSTKYSWTAGAYADDRLGLYVYGKPVWYPPLNMWVGIYGVEVAADTTSIIVGRWQEV